MVKVVSSLYQAEATVFAHNGELGAPGQGADDGGIGGTGGTQTAGAGFGYGASPSEGTGGGGGYYGGKNGTDTGAGGGSGYIGNEKLVSTESLTKHMICYNCTESTGINTKTTSVNNFSSSAVSDKPKSGNGYAKITFISEFE